MPGPDKHNEKKIDKAALELASNAMVAGAFDRFKAEEIADYCVAVAKRIIEQVDSDGG